MLVERPHIGVALTLRAPELAGMRKWSVDGFPNYLIFYLPQPSGVVDCATAARFAELVAIARCGDVALVPNSIQSDGNQRVA